jgi:hypothetical protein
VETRIPLSSSIETRDGTMLKDPQMWNCYVEPTGIIAKRPGIVLSSSFGVGIAQGCWSFGSLVMFLQADTIKLP